MLVLAWFGQTITPLWTECKWLYAGRLFWLVFFVIALSVNRANMSLRVVQWVGPLLRWSPTNQISWFGWCCQVCFGTNSSLMIYHPGCTSNTDIHAPPVAPWHPHFCPKAQWHHGFPFADSEPPPSQITPTFSPQQNWRWPGNKQLMWNFAHLLWSDEANKASLERINGRASWFVVVATAWLTSEGKNESLCWLVLMFGGKAAHLSKERLPLDATYLFKWGL